MNRATKLTATCLGIYAGLLGAGHGIFEVLQGNVVPDKLTISAIGAPCQAATAWHACFPALTLLPNLLVTGILAIIAGLLVMLWTAGFVQRKWGGVILILLSLLLVPVGGGFIPAFVGLFAGIAGSQIHAPLTGARGFLARLWPGTLIVFLAWALGGVLLGYFFNQAMLSLSFFLFVLFDIILPLLTVFSALAYDRRSA